MSKRELGFLVIGLGIGLLFAAVAMVEFVLWFHHMFTLGFAWRPGSILLALPFAHSRWDRTVTTRTPRNGIVGEEYAVIRSEWHVDSFILRDSLQWSA